MDDVDKEDYKLPSEPTVWYKLICQHCDKDGYVTYACKYPMSSSNIHSPDGEFEILPHSNNKMFMIKHKCSRCNGLKYNLYCSSEWKLETIVPKQEKIK